MLIVKNIEVLQVPNDKHKIFEAISSFKRGISSNGCLPPEQLVDIKEEMITGRIFVNNRGERFCIGVSEQVQEAIGLPFEAFENINRRIETDTLTISKLKTKNAVYQNQIDKYKNMNFWQKLKWLFK
jgi:hypothetical protein